MRGQFDWLARTLHPRCAPRSEIEHQARPWRLSGRSMEQSIIVRAANSVQIYDRRRGYRTIKLVKTGGLGEQAPSGAQ